MKIMVTGGCGFIGSNYIRGLLEKHPDYEIINLDKLTYAGNPNNLLDLIGNPNYTFIQGDICDSKVVDEITCDIDQIIHFAAESHVDRSIEDGSVFVKTNVLGTNTLLQSALENNVELFVHVSTDEVYGSIVDGSFKEDDKLKPSSPYSSSKAGSDLLALSYHTTHGLPIRITRCTNNFGPYQHPEKLIPRFLTNLIEDKKVPIYGTGLNVRDWIYVEDHCSAIDCVREKGIDGEIYNIGGGNELSNLEVTKQIIKSMGKDDSAIEYVVDRKGHDLRYSLDCNKIRGMGWSPSHNFDGALQKTIRWYLINKWWWIPLRH